MEELARRLGNRPILLRNYLVLIPWWQASADYAEVNRILHEARTEAEILGDGWTLGLIDTYEGTTRVLARHAHRRIGAIAWFLCLERAPSGGQPA